MEKQTKVKSKKKSDMPRSIGKQSGESVESVRKKKKKASMGRICRKEGCKPGSGMKQLGVMDDESGESLEPTEEVHIT